MLSPEAAAFKPGANRHQLTPIKSIGEAAGNEEDDLCAWLRNKACLSEKVIGKARVRLDEQDVDTVEALQALRELNGLDGVFSAVPAQQVAKALDAFAALSIAPAGRAPPSSAFTTPVPAARARTAAADGAPTAMADLGQRFAATVDMEGPSGSRQISDQSDGIPLTSSFQAAGPESPTPTAPCASQQEPEGACPSHPSTDSSSPRAAPDISKSESWQVLLREIRQSVHPHGIECRLWLPHEHRRRLWLQPAAEAHVELWNRLGLTHLTSKYRHEYDCDEGVDRLVLVHPARPSCLDAHVPWPCVEGATPEVDKTRVFKLRPGKLPDQHLPVQLFRFGYEQWLVLELYDRWRRGERLTVDDRDDDILNSEDFYVGDFYRLKGEAARVTWLLGNVLARWTNYMRPSDGDCPNARYPAAEQIEVLARNGWESLPFAGQLMQLMVRKKESQFTEARRLPENRTKKWAYTMGDVARQEENRFWWNDGTRDYDDDGDDCGGGERELGLDDYFMYVNEDDGDDDDCDDDDGGGGDDDDETADADADEMHA